MTVFIPGAQLVGTWDVGTAAFALRVGPAVALALRLLPPNEGESAETSAVACG